MNNFWRIGVLMMIVFLAGCTPKVFETVYPALRDGKFDSEFPYRNCSQELREIGETVKMLYVTAYYRTVFFTESERIRFEDLSVGEIVSKGKVSYSQNSVVGTAIVIDADDYRVALLTCSHIVDFDDSLIVYYPNGLWVKSFTVKEKQINFIRDIPEEGEMEVLARDAQKDVAVIGKRFTSAQKRIPVFHYPLGFSKELEWGTFIYILGYPMGYKMITKGIVSSPDRDGKGTFLTDAPFNRGFSGGAVLAIRDGVPNFELVGLAKSVSATSNYVLSPSKDFDPSAYDSGTPYEGPVFVDMRTDIRYGITTVISTETIRDFFRDHQTRFEQKGFDFSRFLQTAKTQSGK